jgi:hypothetical protein
MASANILWMYSWLGRSLKTSSEVMSLKTLNSAWRMAETLNNWSSLFTVARLLYLQDAEL